MKKKSFIIVGIVAVLLVSAALVTSYIDSARVRNSVEPKCAVKIVSADGNKVTYWGLGYKVIRYPSVSPNEPYKNNRGVKYGSWFMDYEPPIEDGTKEEVALIPMVKVNGVLYLDTGIFSTPSITNRTHDGEITSAVKSSEKPTENDQSNFETGYGYVIGSLDGTIELDMNGQWRIFATEEVRQQIQFPEKSETAVIEIRDRAKEENLPCDTALEKFYEDESKEYYFSVIKSQYVIVTYSDGSSEDIVTALTAGRVAIADLDEFGIEYHTEPKPILQEPPTLYVLAGEIQIEGLMGTSSWIYPDENGELTGIMGDSQHPLLKKEITPVLDLVPTYYSSIDPLCANLQFGAAPNNVMPNEIFIRCWSEEDWGNSAAESENISVNFDNGYIFFHLKDGNYIYEVVATWNSSDKHSGTVSYSFCTAKSPMKCIEG